VGFISCVLWFLVAGGLHHYKEDGDNIASSLFWSFMIFIIFIPAATALILLAIVLHLVNYVSVLPTPVLNLHRHLANRIAKCVRQPLRV